MCVSVHLFLREQPRKVSVWERCQQPRNGLGMESVSQIGTQGQPEVLLQPLRGHSFHLSQGRSGAA